MTQFKSSDRNTQAVRQLADAELDTVAGGIVDGCIPNRPIGPVFPTTGWTFKDIFAKPTLGTFH